jgi:SAM-dependent methyltransferase
MARINWQTADPHALPFADATFGIVTSHFSVAAMPDRVRVFKEARRVIKQAGRFVFSLPGYLRHNPAAHCVQDVMDELFPANPPRFVAHVFHGYADNEVVDDDLTAAGFTDAIYTTVELPFAAASARDAATGYCLGTPLYTELELRTGGDTEPVLAAATLALQQRFGPGAIATTMRAHVVSAAG